MTTIRIANQHDQAAWDNFVHQQSNASPYHLFAWKTAIEQTYKHKGYYLIAEAEQAICGILPLILVQPPLASATLCSLPFCDLGGIIASDQTVVSALMNKAATLCKELKAGKLELRSRSMNNGSTLSEEQKVSMLLPLPDSSAELLAQFKSKLRSQINKAKKNGLTVSFEKTPQNINAFYNIFANNMKRLGSPVHSRQLFHALNQAYGEQLLLAVVSLDNTAVGAGIVLRAGNRACIPWASTLFEYNRLSPNMLLYWSLLEQLADSGCKHFDFGRSSYNCGTYKFKAQWGAQPQALEWQQYDSNGELSEAPQSNGKARNIIEQLWQKQPLASANFFGPMVRKYITL
ncbi:FemAB family PEP-CTERM system-associated protein [Dasania sp. GY-MA-18]|uniref:FemAB family PEP-CTERM system-associated protein n=1 Tax=Dasania phycosphaerae TaxID=2950436 RepID=A0A9J6RQX8_9GAMM|nr:MULTISPECIES: FemAB family XrtA/PEP-CTERM system-associated protein [Dasania]MCR8924124.1 FemAB family PEP-CTERM system-associated protein [Dasania sp. GY-MA-18]MCZ0866697.1 FemAB family PEP-CTERM system-associated protein [Dasania phycosphaerae]MCZ0870282.1 FemAB family PEP-CTERM system-associated protein [Dasania phycosphaerae]